MPTTAHSAWTTMCSLGLGLTPPPGPSPQGQWTIHDLARLGLEVADAYEVNGAAVEAGLAEPAGRVGPGGTGLPVYQLTEAGARAARRTLDGAPPPAELAGDWKRRVWQACRVARRFTVPDLMPVVLGQARYDRVYRFVRRLESAGALARDPRRGTHITWRVVGEYGPALPCT